MTERTNTIRALCPKCTEHIPVMKIINDDMKISFDCRCKYKEEMLLKDYIEQYNAHPERMCKYINKCECHNSLLEYYCRNCATPFCQENQHHICEGNYDREYYQSEHLGDNIKIDELKEKLKQSQEFLDVYFPSLKEEFMKKEQSKEKIDKFNAVYSKAVERSKIVLQFSNILIENYHNDNRNLHDNVINNIFFNMFKYVPDKSTDSLIDYFDNFSFTVYKDESEFTVESKNSKIQYLVSLKDNRLAFFLYGESKVSICDPFNKWNIDCIIKLYGNCLSLCVLENGNLVTRSGDGTLNVFSIAKNSYKKELTIQDPCALNRTCEHMTAVGNKIAFNVNDKNKVLIWDTEHGKSEKPYRVINDIDVRTLVYCKAKNYLLMSPLRNETPKDALLVYDITNDKIIAQFRDCNGGIEFTPVMIDDTRACVMTLGKRFIVDLEKLKVEVADESYVYSDYNRMLRDGKTMIGLTEKGRLSVLDVATGKMSMLHINPNRKVDYYENVQILEILNENYFVATCGLTIFLRKY